MKKDTHPKYYDDSEVKCSCGASFSIGSTKKEVKTEVCSACHPFYTGKKKILDTMGRVEKFKQKMAKKQK
jgi:large subunit ribosomal protein L31